MTHRRPFDLYISACAVDGGIFHYRLKETGEAEKAGFIPMDRPMYMVNHEDRLYCLLREAFPSGESGLALCDIAPDGTLQPPSESLSTKGKVACHLSVSNGAVYAVNYVSGSVIRMPDVLRQHRGSSIHPTRQCDAHPHCVTLSPDGKYLLATDLGMDKVLVYDQNLVLQSDVSMRSGCGPRHLAPHGDGVHVFCANELDSTVSVLKYHSGTLELTNTVSALPRDFAGESTAGAIRCIGDRVYVSNRGHDTIAEFLFTGGTLQPRRWISAYGQCPRDFYIRGGLLIVANQLSNNVSLIRLEDGVLLSSLDIPTPLCVLAK